MAMMEWESFDLNQSLLENIKYLFKQPTEIQEKVLVYTSKKVDLLIQARTGEGKTLCYGIPIINYLLNCYSRLEIDEDEKVGPFKLSPSALILVPTRELGIQVKTHLEMVLYDSETGRNLHNIIIANVLGGFAKPKQIKVLNKLNPEIIIATPGRLWEIIENEESPLLEKLTCLKFLVIDEADRMTERGHFVELKNIIEHVYNRIELKKKTNDGNANEGNEKGKRMIKTIQSEITQEEDLEENEKLARKLKVDSDNIETLDPLELLSDEADYDEEIDMGNEDEGDNNLDIDEEKDMDNDDQEYDDHIEDEEIDDENKDNDQMNNDEEEHSEQDDEEDSDDIEEDEDYKKNLIDFRNIEKEKRKELSKIELNPYISMRTFLCSATIDQIHFENIQYKSKGNKKNHKEKKSSLTSEEQHFQKLIRNLKFYHKLLYVKLKHQKSNLITSTSNSKDNKHQSKHQSSNQREEDYMESTVQILPEKLEIDCYKCDPSTKDYYLFHILKENKDKRIIIFTNSISHTKKLYSIFSYFNEFKCTVLHSKMLQNARIKNLDRFSSNQINVLFCTDIGARGLDIPHVDLVIHYHIPQKTETFIHRSGRTARANRSGKVTSLITQKELMLYKKAMIDLHYTQFAMKTLSLVQLEKIKSLFEYAKQIERETFQIKKANREKQWYKKTAQQCDMLVDDDYDFDGNRGGGDDDDKEDKEAKAQEKYLNKKRNLLTKQKLHQKKMYTRINESSIKRTSYLTPELVQKWNALIKESNYQKENLTQALYQAHNDARSIRFKEKPKKKRYQRRRKKK